MNEPDNIEIVNAMIDVGGIFVKALGELYRRADFDNRRRLKFAFPEYWKQYTEVARAKMETRK